jgi:hypothetical protein
MGEDQKVLGREDDIVVWWFGYVGGFSRMGGAEGRCVGDAQV